MTGSASDGRRRGRPPADAPPVATEQELLRLALDTFAELGYEGTSVRDLCRRLNVSHNLIHQRYGSKEALWFAAMDEGFGTLSADLNLELGRDLDGARLSQPIAPDDPDMQADDEYARLRAVWIRFIVDTGRSPALLQVINQEANIPGPRLDFIFQRFIRPAMAIVEEMSSNLTRQGRLKQVSISTLYFLIGHGVGGPVALRGLAEKFGPVLTDEVEIRSYAEEVVDLILAGMQPDTG